MFAGMGDIERRLPRPVFPTAAVMARDWFWFNLSTNLAE